MAITSTAGSNAPAHLREVLTRNRERQSEGVFGVCSSNQFVLHAAAQHAAATGNLLLIESTSNQVNQHGGYTHQIPGDFAAGLMRLASAHKLATEQLCLGADHAGPNPWQNESARVAMSKAADLVRASVLAGYQKIHLDASMHCGDDNPNHPLPPPLAAERAALLCQAAEQASSEVEGRFERPVYVIGTEVPAPGGAQGAEENLAITRVEDALETIALTKAALLRRGLDDAWSRVIALVVQPGVEFSDQSVHAFEPDKAQPLFKFIKTVSNIVFEAHSTDYQARSALKQLVEGHFAILKVGPALTFAFREALFALAFMEAELQGLHSGMQPSALLAKLEAQMLARPAHWKPFYRGSQDAQAFARHYSFSDRARYYWDSPELRAATAQLISNLERYPVPLSLLSQYLPVQYRKIQEGHLPRQPQAWITDKISAVLDDYAYACGQIVPTSPVLPERQ